MAAPVPASVEASMRGMPIVPATDPTTWGGMVPPHGVRAPTLPSRAPGSPAPHRAVTGGLPAYLAWARLLLDGG